MNPFTRLARPDEFKGDRYWDPHTLVTTDLLEGQHPIRAWEYSQAFRALEHGGWDFNEDRSLRFADVGGAGSHFASALARAYTNQPIHLIDPNADQIPVSRGEVRTFPMTLREYVAFRSALEETEDKRASFDCVFCLSVLEHVKQNQVPAFLHDLFSLLRPGGLLVLTCDVGPDVFDPTDPDRCHFHWMREWLPRSSSLRELVGMRPVLGEEPVDFTWEGPTVYDYTVGSIALVKPLASA